jgi:hypothetical protein
MEKSLWRGVKVVGLILWVSDIYDISSMRTTNIHDIEDVDICRSRLHYAIQIPSKSYVVEHLQNKYGYIPCRL